jgi:hypothetical protein
MIAADMITALARPTELRLSCAGSAEVTDDMEGSPLMARGTVDGPLSFVRSWRQRRLDGLPATNIDFCQTAPRMLDLQYLLWNIPTMTDCHFCMYSGMCLAGAPA